MAKIDVCYWLIKVKKDGMKREIDIELGKWVTSRVRIPLLLRGARQIGKTFTIKKLAKTHFNVLVFIPRVKPISVDSAWQRGNRALSSCFCRLGSKKCCGTRICQLTKSGHEVSASETIHDFNVSERCLVSI